MTTAKKLKNTVEEFKRWRQTAEEYENSHKLDPSAGYAYRLAKEAFSRCASRLEQVLKECKIVS